MSVAAVVVTLGAAWVVELGVLAPAVTSTGVATLTFLNAEMPPTV